MFLGGVLGVETMTHLGFRVDGSSFRFRVQILGFRP